MLDDLPEVFGTPTDLRIKNGIETYREVTNNGEDLKEVFLNGDRDEWEVEWEKWVKGLNGIVYGIVGFYALNHFLIDDLLYENSMWFCIGRISDRDMRDKMWKAVFNVEIILDILESLEGRIESKHLYEKYKDPLMLECRMVAYEVIEEVSEKFSLKKKDEVWKLWI